MSDVLALRALGLGDALAAVPALRSLRTAWPGRRLVLAGPAAIGRWLAAAGVVDAALDVADLDDAAALRRLDRAPDVAVNLHGSGPQSHRLLHPLGASTVVAYRCPQADHLTGPEWDPDEHEVDRWLRLTSWAGGHGSPADLRLPAPGPRADHVVLHPGAAYASRRWPAQRWAGVARVLVAQGRRVLVTGVADEVELCTEIADQVPVDVLAGEQDLTALARTVGTAALLLCADTGVAHLATAFATPSVVLFGPVSPSLWGPRIDTDIHVALWAGDPDEPRPGNALGTTLDARLAEIQVGQVLEAALHLLGRASHTGSAKRSEPAQPAAAL